MKISLFLQLANFIVGHTYLGSPELQFKPKFDPVAQMVQELDRNIRVPHAGKIQLSVQIILFLYSGLFFLFHILILAQETYNLSPSLTL